MEQQQSYKPKYPVLTLEKALDVINYFKENTNPEGLSLNEICQALDMKKSSVHRILDTLYAYDYVKKTFSGNRYKLSWALYDIGNSVPKQYSLSANEYLPALNTLCQKYSETFSIGVLDKTEYIVINIVEPNIQLKSTGNIGERRPLYATGAGKLFLSEFPENKIYHFYRENKIESFTKTTLSTPGRMLNELYDIKQCGYAIDNEEHCEGLSCISMPIYDFKGRIVAAISGSGPTQRIMGKIENGLKDDLREITCKLSVHLGYKGCHENKDNDK